MRSLTWTTVAALLLSGAALAQEDKKQHREVKPGKQHEALKYFEGTWDAKVRFEGDKGKEPMESKGTETSKFGAGDFWLMSKFEGEMMGKPFKGHGMMGYDLQKQKYIGVWVDSMQSNLFLSEGTADADYKSWTMVGTGYCDMEGKSITMKQVYQIKDKDSFTLHFFKPSPDGPDKEVGTITYTRRK